MATANDFGFGAMAIHGDVRSSRDMQVAVERVFEEWGRIDILCNNAGVCFIESVDEMTDETLDLVIDVNVKGAFNLMRHVAPIMKRQRSGKVINISSAGGIKAQPLVSHYAASKGAINVVTKSWASELAEWGINVNAIAPGTVLTPMIEALGAQQGVDGTTTFEMFNENNLFQGERGHVTAADIAKMAVFLASDDARMITGQVVAVDAGFSTS